MKNLADEHDESLSIEKVNISNLKEEIIVKLIYGSHLNLHV